MDREVLIGRLAWIRLPLRVFQLLCLLIGFLFLLVTFTPLTLWWGTLLAGPWNDPPGDVLIVLGGSVHDDGMIDLTTYWRSAYAVRAWKEGWFHLVVISGGSSGPVPPAEAMREFLVSQGVPREAILVEPRSRNTRENALFTRDLVASLPGTKVLLTSDYHMFRAHRAFRKVGLDVLPRPFPDVRKRSMRWTGRWPAFLDLASETTKILYYSLRGWLSGLADPVDVRQRRGT